MDADPNDRHFAQGQGPVIGRCPWVEKACLQWFRYGHDVLHCKACQKNGVSSEPCTLKRCPCKGQGRLFRTATRNSFVHQHPDHSSSVRIRMNRPKMALELVSNHWNRYLNIVEAQHPFKGGPPRALHDLNGDADNGAPRAPADQEQERSAKRAKVSNGFENFGVEDDLDKAIVSDEEAYDLAALLWWFFRDDVTREAVEHCLANPDLFDLWSASRDTESKRA